jgi:hypothetical protein
MPNWLERAIDVAFRDPVTMFIGLVVGLAIGYFAGLSSGRYSR